MTTSQRKHHTLGLLGVLAQYTQQCHRMLLTGSEISTKNNVSKIMQDTNEHWVHISDIFFRESEISKCDVTNLVH
jgi:hypothetical protein